MPVEIAREIRPAVQKYGGAFMTSPELAEVEREVGLGQRALYFRGRSAVLGDPSPSVVAELFGIFPRWVVDVVLPPATEVLGSDAAVSAYTEALYRWSKAHLRESALGELLPRLVAAADASGLALFAGWKQVSWPADPVARIGHGLMLLREYRGGVHFAALRAVGLTVPEAVVADPEGGRARLLRTAWSPEAADELIARARRRPDLEARRRRAESLTDERMGELLEVLSAAERDALVCSLADLGREE
ncbi:SCO6745 family protein [Amycolatopsis sp. 3B14]|uniref:SCO6745 family protein n=1 Tax=Amycolatopsis sp. 3B14 TaxID=3243600 RepID=UPI003D97A2A7